MIEFRPMTDEEFEAYRSLFIDHYADLLANSEDRDADAAVGLYEKMGYRAGSQQMFKKL